MKQWMEIRPRVLKNEASKRAILRERGMHGILWRAPGTTLGHVERRELEIGVQMVSIGSERWEMEEEGLAKGVGVRRAMSEIIP